MGLTIAKLPTVHIEQTVGYDYNECVYIVMVVQFSLFFFFKSKSFCYYVYLFLYKQENNHSLKDYSDVYTIPLYYMWSFADQPTNETKQKHNKIENRLNLLCEIFMYSLYCLVCVVDVIK